MRRRGSPADASDALRPTIFGDAALDVWAAPGAGHPGEAWNSFERARQLAQAGHQDEAVTIWQQIAAIDGLESRHTLQAWHFLRQAGQPPPADQARLVLGVAAEIPVRKGHDLLAAYRDGTARYLNYSGKALIWEDHSDTRIGAAITGWLAAGQLIADAIGVWDQPSLPALPAGHARLIMLTPRRSPLRPGPRSRLVPRPQGRPVPYRCNQRPPVDHQPHLTSDPAGPRARSPRQLRANRSPLGGQMSAPGQGQKW